MTGASSPDPRAQRAADNNARWCSSVCRVHGIRTSVQDGVWLAASQPPVFYPHAITLQPGVCPEALVAALPAGGAGCAVKDSFADLDLTPMGFAVLFEAEWIWRSGPVAGECPDSWEVVRDGEGLSEWALAAGQPDTFRRALLDDPDVRFLVEREGNQVVGGAALSRSEGVIGVSNVLAREGAGAVWSDLAAAAASSYPGLPLCGYESGEDLQAALSSGFEAVGPLRVWARSA